ncbi:ankyrin repeat domain-containing protein 49-like [Prorops nasuta]|uniref:ankyrin repeat domain-containing protein 49-like n=1 Tax=Prorops nasuta TaxID=863751 RepID=UPI0034CF42A8
MSSDEENDCMTDLETIRDNILNMPRNERMQVSAWDDDNEGIEENRNPKEPDKKAILDAAEKGDLQKIKLLLIKDKSLLYATDQDGYTPLHRACYGNHPEVIKWLIDQGADISAKTNDGWQPLHSACYWNNIECISLLLSYGADINATSKGDQTPLHLVSANSHNSPALQLLLMHPEINANLKNASGDTAFDIAKRTGKYYPMFEIVEPCLNEI